MVKKISTEKPTALHFINEVMTKVTNAKPTTKEMMIDIKMMDFKIRPLSGDVFELAERHTSLLEHLWRIGRTEAIIRRAVITLEPEERDLFFSYIDNLERKMEEIAIRELHDVPLQENDKQKVVTLEIFKEMKKRRSIN